MRPVAYGLGLLSVWAACFCAPLIASLDGSLQPLDGDLTRIGGLSERDYGWNEPQLRFKALLTPHFRNLDVLVHRGRAYDVLVIGDSFSGAGFGNAHAFGFQEWMQNALDVSVATIPENEIDYETLACDLRRLTLPPRYLVFETAERYLAPRLKLLDMIAEGARHCRAGATTTLRPAAVSTSILEPFPRPTTMTFEEMYATFVARVAAKVTGVIGIARNSVRTFHLGARDLFSSTRADQLLVVDEDLSPNALDPMGARRTVQNAADTLAMAAGVRLVLLVAPNKLSAYRSHVEEATPAAMTPLLGQAGVPMASVQDEIARLIGAGFPDVYLPNDTHWGYRGHCAAAFAVGEYLNMPWRIDRCDAWRGARYARRQKSGGTSNR
ncbi:MAG TPA: hypothetical protein VF304_19350 [Casimicrobiaceae bacterium]